MKVLIACEFSGTVREAFRRRGHDAWSCDLLPTEIPGQHVEGDVLSILDAGWDLMIAHPPCTHLAVSGARWWATKAAEQDEAIKFFMDLANANIPKIAIENPISIMSSRWRKPDQIIQPWMFGHTEQKATCLWLEGLKPLAPTNNVKEEMMLLPKNQRERLHYLPPSPDRWKERSRTYLGIAEAMALQWGGDVRHLNLREAV